MTRTQAVAYLGGATVRWPPFGPTMKIFYRRLYMKRCVFAVFQQICLKMGEFALLLNVQKQKAFQLQGGFAPGLCRGLHPQTPVIGAHSPCPPFAKS